MLLPLVLVCFKRSDLAEPRAELRRDSAPAANVVLDGSSLREASRRRQFWQLALLCALVAIVEGAMVVHLFPILNEGGLDRAVAAGVASLMGLALVIGRVCSGLLYDRFSAPAVVAGEIFLMMLSCLLARVFMGGVVEVMAIAALFGLGAGGIPSAWPTLPAAISDSRPILRSSV